MKSCLIVTLTFILFLGVPSCHCPNFQLITGVQEWYFFDHENPQRIEGGEIVTDTLSFSFLIDFEAYTGSGNPDIGWMTEADAYGGCVTTHIANTIRSMTFFSNAPFNDVPAGEPLNQKIWSTDYNAPMDAISVFLDPAAFDYQLRFRFLEKPVIPTHTFSILITDNAGNTFLSQAQPLTWL